MTSRIQPEDRDLYDENDREFRRELRRQMARVMTITLLLRDVADRSARDDARSLRAAAAEIDEIVWGVNFYVDACQGEWIDDDDEDAAEVVDPLS